MNTEYKNNDVRKQESEINITDIFHLILVNWYWFVLVCFGLWRGSFLLFKIFFQSIQPYGVRSYPR